MSSVPASGTRFRKTVSRSAILTVIRDSGHPLTSPEIHCQAKQVQPRLGIATVYRFVNALLASGEVQEVHIPGEAAVRYEAACKAHHHHFRCEECRRIFNLPGCVSLVPLVPDGFEMFQHDIVLYGRCRDCQGGDGAKG